MTVSFHLMSDERGKRWGLTRDNQWGSSLLSTHQLLNRIIIIIIIIKQHREENPSFLYYIILHTRQARNFEVIK